MLNGVTNCNSVSQSCVSFNPHVVIPNGAVYCMEMFIDCKFLNHENVNSSKPTPNECIKSCSLSDYSSKTSLLYHI